MENTTYKQIASETITVSSTAVGFTAAKIEGALFAECYLESADIRIWLDGTAPTSSTGRLIFDGTPFQIWDRSNMVNFKAIRTGSTDAKLTVMFFAVDGIRNWSL